MRGAVIAVVFRVVVFALLVWVVPLLAGLFPIFGSEAHDPPNVWSGDVEVIYQADGTGVERACFAECERQLAQQQCGETMVGVDPDRATACGGWVSCWLEVVP